MGRGLSMRLNGRGGIDAVLEKGPGEGDLITDLCCQDAFYRSKITLFPFSLELAIRFQMITCHAL